MLYNLLAASGVQISLLISGTLVARLLGPEGRGYAALLTVWPSAFAQLGAVGLALAVTYYLSSGRIGGREVVRLLRATAALQTSLIFAANAVVIMTYVVVSGAPIVPVALVSLLQIPPMLAADYGFALLLGARRHRLVTVFRIAGPACYAASLIVLTAIGEDSLAVVMLCLIGSIAVGGFGALLSGLRATRPLTTRQSLIETRGRREARREILAFGRKGYVGYLSPLDSFRIDQLAVGLLVSPHALGIYVVGAAFTNFGRLVAQNIGLSATAEIAQLHGAVERRAAIRRTMILAVAILTGVTAVLGAAVVVAIPLLFGDEYRGAIAVAEVLFAAGWMLSIKRVTVDVLRGAGKPQIGTAAEIVNLSVFACICVPLALAIGGIGVAIALAVAAATGTLVLLVGLRTLYRRGEL